MVKKRYWELLAIVTGYLGPVQLAAHVGAVMLATAVYVIALGIGTTATTLVGEAVAAGDETLAKKYCAVSMYLMIVVWLIFIFPPLFFAPTFVASFITYEQNVVHLLEKILPWFAILGLFDNLDAVISGSLRSLGKTTECAWAYFFINYLVMLPGAILLGFRFQLGVLGVWIASLIGVSLICILLWRMQSSVSFQYLVQAARGRVQRVSNLINDGHSWSGFTSSEISV